MIIYKFIGNPEFIFTTLLNGQLWFSKVEDFKDEFEWKYRYCIDIEKDKNNISRYVKQNFPNRPIEEQREIYNYYINSPKSLEDKLNRKFDLFYDQGVCCFTENENIINEGMWKEYANSHKGITLGFDESEIGIMHTDHLKGGHYINEPLVRKVIYDNRKMCINYFDKESPRILDTKYMKMKSFENEKEIRLVSPKFGMHSFEKNSLKEIIFGKDSTAILKDSVLNILGNDLDYYDVKIRYCITKNNELKIEYI